MDTSYNIINDSDAYKKSMYVQYPSDTEAMFSYVEARGGKYEESVFFGIKYIVENFLTKPITKKHIKKAEKIAKMTNMPFNKEGWEYILNTHNGYIPVRIKSLKEGTIIKTGNALVTIESLDKNVFWIATHIETILLRIWYPITVASKGRNIKKIIKKYVDKTSDFPESINWKLHDFGARAVTSHESSGIGGMAHLVNFFGTDTDAGIETILDTYDMEDFIVGTVPASEHSTMTAWGRENENLAYRNMLEKFAVNDAPYKSPIVSCVSDAYDIINAVENIWGKELKPIIESSDTKLVVRPDSGDTLYMVMMCIEKLNESFGHTINSKGYKVLKNVAVIQGDGVDEDDIEKILKYMELAGWSTDNITFGMGGALLQKINRDTMKFALKCSAVYINGKWHDVYKDPITDKGKTSKKGLIDVYYDSVKNDYVTLTDGITAESMGYVSALNVVYETGNTFFTEEDNDFNVVRQRANV